MNSLNKSQKERYSISSLGIFLDNWDYVTKKGAQIKTESSIKDIIKTPFP